MAKNIIDEIIEKIDKEVSKKVLKSVPATKAELKKWKELNKATDEAQTAYNKCKTLRKIFWGNVESRLKDFDHPMKFNEKTNEIEILDND